MRHIIMGLLTVLFAVSFLSCTKSEKTPKDALVVALGTKPNTLDPRYATDANGMRISALLFNSLVRIGPNLDVVGDAAKEWSYNNKTYTFKLHKGLSFSNGRPLEVDDILFTFEQFKADDNPFNSAFKEIESIDAQKTDDGIVLKIKMKVFSAKFLTSDLPVLKFLPKKETIEAGKDFAKSLIGTGSFKYTEETANEIKLTARKNHPFAAPKINNLTFKIIRDDFTRYQKTLKGAIDIAQAEIPPAKVREFDRRTDNFKVYRYPGLSMAYILINLEDEILKNKDVRHALAQSINRQEIIDYKLEGLATVATSILTPSNPFFNKALVPIAYDLEKAKTLIKNLGLAKKTLILKTSNSQQAVENGRVIANQLQAIGLKVELQSFEWGTFYGDVKKGNFQLATMRWIGALDPDIYRIALHSAELPPGRNRGRYVNKKFDQLVEDGLKIVNPQDRIKHYQEVQKIVLNELPIIPLWYDQQVAIVNKRVKDYDIPMNGDFSGLVKARK